MVRNFRSRHKMNRIKIRPNSLCGVSGLDATADIWPFHPVRMTFSAAKSASVSVLAISVVAIAVVSVGTAPRGE